MFDFERRVSICDVGAAISGTGNGQPEWHGLVEAGLANVIGFEPDERSIPALQAYTDHYEFLPYFVGNGESQKFHLNDFHETSSLLPSNTEVLKHYLQIGPLMNTNKIIDCETTKLDDALGDRKIDVLKIDVQGAALDVLKGGLSVLANTLLVQCEVEFNPLYKGQPLFSDIDIFMREHGFMLYTFSSLKNLPLRPLELTREQLQTNGQLGWTDAVYIPNHERLSELSAHDLHLLALFVALRYGYTDLSCHLLMRANPEAGMDDVRHFLNEVVSLKSISFKVAGQIHRIRL